MNPTEYIIEVLTNFRLLKIFGIVLIMLLLINKLIFKSFVNGIFMVIFSSAIVFSVFIDLYVMGLISTYKLIYFLFSDVLIFFLVLFLYRILLSKINKQKLLLIVNNFNNKYFIIAVIWMFYGILVNMQNVSWDGASRISFQTARWYSFFRMVSTFINPVVGILLIFNLIQKSYIKFLILLLLTIILSVTAGSKSGFLISILASYLLFKDLLGFDIKLKAKIYVPLIIFIVGIAIVNLIFMGIDSDKIFERIVHYAEATIMVFPSNNPCTVCENQSMIALIHRGFGRLFNDSSSLLDNNLFGFALSSEFYGGETMTGPNARIGAYSICAFPGLKIIVLYFVFLVSITFSWLLINLSERTNSFIYISTLLIVIDSLQHFVIDYNVAMSNFTLMIFVLFILLFRMAIRSKPLKGIA